MLGVVQGLYNLPLRVVSVLVELLLPAERQALARTCQVWARNLRFCAGSAGQAFKLGLRLKNSMVEYGWRLAQLLTYQGELCEAHIITAQQSQLLFGNLAILKELNDLARRVLYVRVSNWAAGDSVLDLVAIEAEGLQVLALYHANYKVVAQGLLDVVRSTRAPLALPKSG